MISEFALACSVSHTSASRPFYILWYCHWPQEGRWPSEWRHGCKRGRAGNPSQTLFNMSLSQCMESEKERLSLFAELKPRLSVVHAVLHVPKNRSVWNIVVFLSGHWNNWPCVRRSLLVKLSIPCACLAMTLNHAWITYCKTMSGMKSKYHFGYARFFHELQIKIK